MSDSTGTKSINSIELAKDFLRFCEANPTMRFWQALRSWSGYHFIFVSNQFVHDEYQLQDTYYFIGKNKKE